MGLGYFGRVDAGIGCRGTNASRRPIREPARSLERNAIVSLG